MFKQDSGCNNQGSLAYNIVQKFIFLRCFWIFNILFSLVISFNKHLSAQIMFVKNIYLSSPNFETIDSLSSLCSFFHSDFQNKKSIWVSENQRACICSYFCESFLYPMFRSWGLHIKIIFDRKLFTSESVSKITRFKKYNSRIQGTKPM